MKIVLFGDPVAPFHEVLKVRLPPHFEVVSIPSDASGIELEAGFTGAKAAIAVRYDQKIRTADGIRLVQVPGVGYDEIALSALPENATLCNVKGHGPAVSEYVILSMLESCHRFCSANTEFRAGSWARSSRFKGTPHKELFGSVVGLLGYGLIGKSIAARLNGFGVTTLVCNRSRPVEDGLFKAAYDLGELAQMTAECDFLVVSIALAPETVGLVNSEVLASLSSEGILVNIARGPIVEEDALFQALVEGTLGGAILDVWYNYPSDANDLAARPSRHDFAALPNVYMTPHIAGWTAGTVAHRCSAMADNIIRLSTDQPLLNIVHNPSTNNGDNA